jgi:catechol 2,3-dioxygenase-like lactoylglutathione lyase family enzyme
MLQRPSHRGLRHLALGVRQLEAMKRFYVDLLGFDVEWEPDADNVYLSSGIDNLAAPFDSAHDRPRIARGKPVDHRGEQARSFRGDCAIACRWMRAAFLESRGVTIDAPPRTATAPGPAISDPDGNSVQIIHHPPISGKI